jgi:Lhr-like helicase
MRNKKTSKNMKQRIKLTESQLHRIIKESVNKVLNEGDIYKEQWEDEINLFMQKLERGGAIVEDGIVAVEWGHDKKDPRFIVYKEGEDRLTDDHFSAQHSRRLTDNELKDIQFYARKYGVDIEVPVYEYEDWYDDDED